MREGDDDAFVGDQVFDGDLAFVGHELGQARRGVLLLDGLQLGLDDGHHARFLGQDVQQVLDPLEQLLVFGLDLVDFQAGQLVEAQFQDGVGLPFAERVAAVGQARLAADQNADRSTCARVNSKASSLIRASSRLLTAADDADELVQVGQRDQVAFQHLRAFLGLAQFESACGE